MQTIRTHDIYIYTLFRKSPWPARLTTYRYRPATYRRVIVIAHIGSGYGTVPPSPSNTPTNIPSRLRRPDDRPDARPANDQLPDQPPDRQKRDGSTPKRKENRPAARRGGRGDYHLSTYRNFPLLMKYLPV